MVKKKKTEKVKKSLAKQPKKKTSGANLIYGASMAFITIAASVSLFAQYQIKLDLNAQEKDVRAQLSQQEKTKKRLTDESNNQDSPEFVEKIAREKLNMVKPNEIVFVDENQEESTSGTSNPLTTTQNESSDN